MQRDSNYFRDLSLACTQAAYLASEPFLHVLGALDQPLRLLELMLADVHQLWGNRHLLRHDVTTPIFRKGQRSILC